MSLELFITLIVLICGIALVLWTSWLERRPKDSFDTHLVPTTPVMFIGVLIALVAIVKILAIYGIHLPARGR